MADVAALMRAGGHEQLLVSHDPACGYVGLVAIHDTTLGPALGGTRLWAYGSFDAAVTDVLRLARGMTYKAAVAGLDLGGGKAVILGDPRRADREALFRVHGRFIDTLGGRYITAEDVGTTPQDMEHVRAETRHVGGLLGQSGDPSPVTAYGVFRGMQAGAQHRWGTPDLAGRTVAVQGAGNVAYHLCRHLHEAGARVLVSDVVAAKAERVAREFGARVVDPAAIHAVDADVLAPCALGATLDDATIPVLRAGVVCGGANNQLAEERHGELLRERGIVYCPDYVANAGGIINIYREVAGWSAERSWAKAGAIFDTMVEVLAAADREGIPTSVAADRRAEGRIRAVAGLDRLWPRR